MKEEYGDQLFLSGCTEVSSTAETGTMINVYYRQVFGQDCDFKMWKKKKKIFLIYIHLELIGLYTWMNAAYYIFIRL